MLCWFPSTWYQNSSLVSALALSRGRIDEHSLLSQYAITWDLEADRLWGPRSRQCRHKPCCTLLFQHLRRPQQVGKMPLAALHGSLFRGRCAARHCLQPHLTWGTRLFLKLGQFNLFHFHQKYHLRYCFFLGSVPKFIKTVPLLCDSVICLSPLSHVCNFYIIKAKNFNLACN